MNNLGTAQMTPEFMGPGMFFEVFHPVMGRENFESCHGHDLDACLIARCKVPGNLSAPRPKSLTFTLLNMSVQLLRPGLKFEIFPRPPRPTLTRTASSYQFGESLELWPKSNEPYIICADMSVQSLFAPDKPIGWQLIDENDRWYFRVTQHGFQPQEVSVRIIGYVDEFPGGRGSIGSIIEYSRADAMILDLDDDGEPEVSSRSPECPGAPRKGPNPFFHV